MRQLILSTAVALTAIAGVAPAFAQTTPAPVTTAPAAAAPKGMSITAPEGYTSADLATVTADQLKGVRVYDPQGNDIAEISDIQLGADKKLAHVITDVGGFLGMGEHRVALNPTQIQLFKNGNNAMRAYVTATKDELKALPAYTGPK